MPTLVRVPTSIAISYRSLAAVGQSPRPGTLSSADKEWALKWYPGSKAEMTTLGTIAMISPLMGLFGTVVGMIEIFGSQGGTGMSSNPQQLAHGISVALYNTAAGLIVAIPSMIFYRHYRGKVDGLVVEMETQAIKLVEIVHGERQQ
jgi:biopolymer transport protein ExbB/TolQ